MVSFWYVIHKRLIDQILFRMNLPKALAFDRTTLALHIAYRLLQTSDGLSKMSGKIRACFSK